MDKYHFKTDEQSLMEKLHMPFAVYQFVDKRVTTLVLSDGFLKLFGYDNRDEAYYDMNHNMYADTHPDDVARVEEAALRFATEGGRYEVVYRTREKGGTDYKMIHAFGEHILTDDGTRLAEVWYSDEGMYMGSDKVSDTGLGLAPSLDRALHKESIVKENSYDYLTGLPSMTYFFELADAGRARIREKGGQSALLFMDLNGMKYFNRKYGFAEGDQLLKSLAGILVRHFSNENCSRFWGDHFVLYADAEGLEDTLRKVFGEFSEENKEKALPIRVGICLMGDEDTGTSSDRAKIACDTLKHIYFSGFAYYDERMQAAAEKRQHIITNLDTAIAEKWIKVYYQPIVRAVNGRVCDEEALARWIDPTRGFLSPADFIPILEEAKLIYKLDLYVLEQVLEKLKIQRDARLYLVPQSVNLSRSDFETCDIVEEIRARVDSAGIGRDLITIEITESTVGSDFEFMKGQIERFRKLGFAVWMDDFGSGYSSLDVLQRLEFDLIKFDMSFMKQFGQGNNGKIILTELMKMATGIGIDTVCEGVETQEQVDFLREIGCSKLQGYFYAKPMPLESILERYEKGIQIGFENPDESEYFEAVGKVNLYDLAVIANDNESNFQNYFNTLPMAILEIQGDKIRFVRSNPSYRDFMKRVFGIKIAEAKTDYPVMTEGVGAYLKRLVEEGWRNGNRAFVDEKMPDNYTVHSFIRRIASNPVTGTEAVALAVLNILDSSASITYEKIARSLAADYFNLFYVDLDTEHFIEYTSDVGREDFAVERHGEDFFNTARRDSLKLLYKDDQKDFVAAFTKENIISNLDKQGTFALSYRLLMDGTPTYVNMKIMRMHTDGNFIIIGVSNVDVQMRQRESLERLRQERVIYTRINALTGDFVALYTVDPATWQYTEYSANADYKGLGIAKEGKDFFNDSIKNSEKAICPEDLPMFRKVFTKENVLRKIKENGRFVMKYHLMIRGSKQDVTLKAVLVNENSGPKLIVGVNMDD